MGEQIEKSLLRSNSRNVDMDDERKSLLDVVDESVQALPNHQPTESPRVEIQEVVIIMDQSSDPVEVLEKARAEDEKTRFDRTRMTLEERARS